MALDYIYIHKFQHKIRNYKARDSGHVGCEVKKIWHIPTYSHSEEGNILCSEDTYIYILLMIYISCTATSAINSTCHNFHEITTFFYQYSQMVCDAGNRTTNVPIDWPGLTHDTHFASCGHGHQLAQGVLHPSYNFDIQVKHFSLPTLLRNSRIAYFGPVHNDWLLLSKDKKSMPLCNKGFVISVCSITSTAMWKQWVNISSMCTTRIVSVVHQGHPIGGIWYPLHTYLMTQYINPNTTTDQIQWCAGTDPCQNWKHVCHSKK